MYLVKAAESISRGCSSGRDRTSLEQTSCNALRFQSKVDIYKSDSPPGPADGFANCAAARFFSILSRWTYVRETMSTIGAYEESA